MWVRKCLPLKIGFQPLSCSLGTILYEWQCFVVQGLGGKFIIFVLMVISCMHYCAMRPKIASGSLRCQFGVMRDLPHVGKVRSRDSPWYPLTLVSPLSLNTEKLGSSNLEVWTIPSAIKKNKSRFSYVPRCFRFGQGRRILVTWPSTPPFRLSSENKLKMTKYCHKYWIKIEKKALKM